MRIDTVATGEVRAAASTVVILLTGEKNVFLVLRGVLHGEFHLHAVRFADDVHEVSRHGPTFSREVQMLDIAPATRGSYRQTRFPFAIPLIFET